MNVRRGSGMARSENSEYVSGNYFATFGVGCLTPGACCCPATTSRERLSLRFSAIQAWQTAHGADATIVGSTVIVQNQPDDDCWNFPSRIFRRPHRQRSACAVDSPE